MGELFHGKGQETPELQKAHCTEEIQRRVEALKKAQDDFKEDKDKIKEEMAHIHKLMMAQNGPENILRLAEAQRIIFNILHPTYVSNDGRIERTIL